MKLFLLCSSGSLRRGFVLSICRHLVLGEWLSVLRLEVRARCCWPSLGFYNGWGGGGGGKSQGQTRRLPLYTHIFVIHLMHVICVFFFFFHYYRRDMVLLVARRLVCVLTPVGSCVLMRSAPILVALVSCLRVPRIFQDA
jgi:hypothetical protein